MGFSWDSILSEGEVIKKEFTISRTYSTAVFLFSVGLAIVISFTSAFAGVLLAVLGLTYWFYLTRAKHYAFTDRRIVLVDSFLSQNVISIDYDKITDIMVSQSFVERLFGIGTLVISTASTHTPQANLAFLDNPTSLKQSLDKIRDKKNK